MTSCRSLCGFALTKAPDTANDGVAGNTEMFAYPRSGPWPVMLKNEGVGACCPFVDAAAVISDFLQVLGAVVNWTNNPCHDPRHTRLRDTEAVSYGLLLFTGGTQFTSFLMPREAHGFCSWELVVVELAWERAA